jgi:TetR/AcrR family transcriptional regulator
MAIPNIGHDKEKLILDAAQIRFARFGFSKVTMDEIAQDMGLAKASLYYYYPTKESLFRAVIAREQEKFLQQTKEIITNDSTTASLKLKFYVKQRLVLGKQLLTLNALTSVLLTESKPGFRDLFAEFSRQELAAIAAIIGKGQESGEFEVAHPMETAELLLHTLQGLRLRFLQSAQTHSEDTLNNEKFEQQVSLLLETLLQGIVKRNAL